MVGSFAKSIRHGKVLASFTKSARAIHTQVCEESMYRKKGHQKSRGRSVQLSACPSSEQGGGVWMSDGLEGDLREAAGIACVESVVAWFNAGADPNQEFNVGAHFPS